MLVANQKSFRNLIKNAYWISRDTEQKSNLPHHSSLFSQNVCSSLKFKQILAATKPQGAANDCSPNLALVNTSSLLHQPLSVPLFPPSTQRYCMTKGFFPPYIDHQPYSILEGKVKSSN